MACVATNLIVMMGLVLYTKTQKDVWPSNLKDEEIQSSAIDPVNIRDFFMLGIPCAVMVCLEWWAYQIMTLLSGYLGVHEQAAQILITNVSGILFMISLGLQQAQSTFVGQEIGKNDI